ncbi:MAG TPA: SDR family oxidoreductase [Pyrinomonadaceae bacterium]|jgi:short-subunit dehydrogenase|nr:SDR family oxidoreductase [Pyrinomonadaceae bacterium]
MLKPLGEQVVVLTGASSGIGRATAIEFGRRGASVVLAARNEEALQGTAREVEAAGGRAHVVVTDVADASQVSRLAEEAALRFGRIDTWVNNAAVSEYGTVEEISLEEIERIVAVNLLGTIYGIKAALPHLRRAGGGAIVNVGSVLSDRAVPLQSTYCATKHAVKGFTEAVRMELEHEGAGVHLTLVKPAVINTPYYNHARTRMRVEPRAMFPVYEPIVVAEAILHAATHPVRDIVAGDGGKVLSVLQRISPSLLDRLMLANGAAFKLQQKDEPPRPGDNLFTPMNEAGATTGEYTHRSTNFSPFTRHLEPYPNRKRLLVAAAALGAFALLRRPRRNTPDNSRSAAGGARVEKESLGRDGRSRDASRTRRSLPPRH